MAEPTSDPQAPISPAGPKTGSPSRSKTASPTRSKTASPSRSRTASPSRSRTASPNAPGLPENATGANASSNAPGSPENATETNASPNAPDSPENATGTNQIEVDDGDSVAETGSTIDDRLSSYTASLTSSVIDYPTEHGRRYHAFRSGSYWGPNDESEMDRLDFNHMLMVKTIGDRLYLAPFKKEKIHRILDIGTGTGVWAMQMGEEFPNTEIIGNDLSAIQPTWVPSNVKFEIDDVESRWVNPKGYDFIFCRYMAASLADWPKLIRRIYKNTNPGGWVEFQDYNLEYLSDDGTLTEKHFTSQWVNKFFEACKLVNREPNPGPRLENWVREAGGFVNITHQRFKIPIGDWPKDPHYKECGMINLIQMLDGLEGFTLRLFTGVLGWTKEEVFVLLAEVRRELKSRTFHSHFDFHVVYAQKPEAEE